MFWKKIDPGRIDRALTQRIYLTEFDAEKLIFKILGSTGQMVYDVVFKKNNVSCSCPDYQNRNLCKHIIFLWIRVLRFDVNMLEKYPENFDQIEKRLENIPNSAYSATSTQKKKDFVPQKPIEGFCPICFEDYEASDEKIVYCKLTCGNNVHYSCYRDWVNYHRKKVCIFCRGEFV